MALSFFLAGVDVRKEEASERGGREQPYQGGQTRRSELLRKGSPGFYLCVECQGCSGETETAPAFKGLTIASGGKSTHDSRPLGVDTEVKQGNGFWKRT